MKMYTLYEILYSKKKPIVGGVGLKKLKTTWTKEMLEDISNLLFNYKKNIDLAKELINNSR